MSVWVMLLGMATLINLTMMGAIVSLIGNVPDSSFLVILSRYLKRRGEPVEALLYPLEAASRLERARKRALQAAAAAAAVAVGLTVWALSAGWGAAAMLAITAWTAAANLAVYNIPLSMWRRRSARMRESEVEEAWRKSRRGPGGQAREEGKGSATQGGPEADAQPRQGAE